MNNLNDINRVADITVTSNWHLPPAINLETEYLERNQMDAFYEQQHGVLHSRYQSSFYCLCMEPEQEGIPKVDLYKSVWFKNRFPRLDLVLCLVIKRKYFT